MAKETYNLIDPPSQSHPIVIYSIYDCRGDCEGTIELSIDKEDCPCIVNNNEGLSPIVDNEGTVKGQ